MGLLPNQSSFIPWNMDLFLENKRNYNIYLVCPVVDMVQTW